MGNVDTCGPVCLASPGCRCLPSLASTYAPSLSHIPTRAHICRADGEGAGVSASSCVTRLISPQPGRLGPEGSDGGGAGPHSPSDKYVFGAAVLKGHGGRKRRRGGRTAPRRWVPARPSTGCRTLSRGMTRCRQMTPSSGLAHPAHSHVQTEMPAWTHRYSNSGGDEHTSLRLTTPRQRLQRTHKDGLVGHQMQGELGVQSQTHPFSLTPTFTPTPKKKKIKHTRVHSSLQ